MTVMDLYRSRTFPSEVDNDEPFYCSPACHSDDVLCAGSDSEETTDEVNKKRKRYEDEARRYLEGHIPILQSAMLRGPLDKESGWVNPWRYRSSKRIGSLPEGTLDRREPKTRTTAQAYMVGKTVQKGLGYLTPAEALEWCEHTVDTESVTAAGIVVSNELSETTKQTERFVGQDVSNITVLEKHLGPRSGRLDCPPSSDRHGLGNGDEKEPRITTTTHTKRSADSRWLQGAYLSKRVRYNGPSISSPSPSANMTGSRYHHATTQIGLTTSNVPLESGDVASRSRFSRSRFSARGSESLLENNGVRQNGPERGNHYIPHDSQEPSTLSAGDHLLRIKTGDRKPRTPLETRGEYQKEHEEGISAISFRYGSSPASHESPSKHMESPVRNRKRARLSHEAASRDQKHTSIVREDDSTLEQHLGALQDSVADDVSLTDGLSFITEVAPSCRDLEKFQYRVKRRLVNSGLWGSSPGPDRSRDRTTFKSSTPRFEPLDCRQISADAASERDTIMEGPKSNSIADDSSVSVERSVSPLQMISLANHSQNRTKNSEDLMVLHEGENADSDWDMVDDVAADPSIVDVVTSTPTVSRINVLPFPKEKFRLSTPTSGTSESQANISLAAMEIPPRETSPPLFRLSSVSRCHSSLDTPRDQALMKSTSEERTTTAEHMVVDQDDISTQSATTNPPTSMRRPQQAASSSQIQTGNIATTHIKAGPGNDNLLSESDEDTENSETDDEMEAIQTVLSQSCSGLNSAETSQARIYDRHSGQTHVDDMPREDANIKINHIQSATEEAINYLKPGQRVSHGSLEQDHAGGIFAIAQEGQTLVQSLGTMASNGSSARPPSAKESEVDKPKTPSPSEGSWQGCGTQSPWVAELAEATTKVISKIWVPMQQVAFKSSSELSTRGLDQDEVLPSPKVPNTPNHLLPSSLNRETNSIASTQMLVEAATKNPWDSSSKNVNLSKTKKRVSFGGLLSDEKENLEIHEAEPPPSNQHIRCASSPLTSFDQHQAAVQHDEQVTTVEELEDRPEPYRKTLKRLLPDQSGSQMHSSPAAIDAMAEAFISADRDMASLSGNERRSIKSKSPVRRHKTLSGTYDDIWKVNKQKLDWSPDSIGPQDDNCTTTDFDMQAALGEMGDFLEDWSVEAELKKARVAGSQNGVSSDPERRSLFGMV